MEKSRLDHNPLVTVLMPVYNAAAYIEDTICSILAQTFKKFEFLIIDDCSTDQSLNIIRSFSDSRIVVHSNEANLGQTKSLNVGLKLASGKYVAINDADDLSLPGRLEKELFFLERHPEYVVVGASSFIMNKEGRVFRRFIKTADEKKAAMAILYDTPVIHGSVMMRREAVLAQGGYCEEMKICQDYELWSRLIANGCRIANLPEILVTVRFFSESISFRENERQLYENAKIMHLILRRLPE